MATYRNVQMSFWTDSKVMDDFTPEDKLFFLYIMTNPLTSLCGCYECSKMRMSRDTGYSVETITNIIYRMENIHHVARYNDETKEILIMHWDKYNWTQSSKVLDGAYKGALQIKSPEFKGYVLRKLQKYGYEIDENILATIPYPYPMDKTVTDTVTDIYINNNYPIPENINSNVEHITNNSTSTKKSNSDNEADEEVVKEVIDYLNARVGANYRPNTAETVKLIHGRLNEGRTIEDFKYVIDVKADEWIGTSQEQYLRPKTLFAQSNFENYLQQRRGVKKKSKRSGKEPVDWDELTEWARKKDQEALEGDIVYDQ